jgi:hypothetical protein
MINKNLCFVFEAPKRTRVHDTVTVALKLAAIGRCRLVVATALALLWFRSVNSKLIHLVFSHVTLTG